MELLWVSLLLCSAVVCYLYSTWTFDYWRKKGIPYVHPVPFFGNLLKVLAMQISTRDLGTLVYRKFPGAPVTGYFIFRQPVLMIKEPMLIKRVLVDDFDCFNGKVIKVDRKLDPLISRNTFSLTGDVWKAVRSLLMPAFTLSKVKNQFPLMALDCRELVKFLEHEAPKRRPDGFEVRDLMRKFTSDIVARCGFGILANSFHESEDVVRIRVPDFANLTILKSVRLVLNQFVPKAWHFLRTRFMDINGQNFMRLLIRELINYREKNRVFRNDYLQMLMHIKYMGHNENGRNMICVRDINIEFSDEDITSHAVMLFFSGSELPAYVLSFLLYELACNMEIQIRLRTEIDSVLAKHSGGLTYESVREMTYLDMVLNECLRMYPPFSVVLRKCSKSCELPLPDGSKITIDEGKGIAIPLEQLHRDPNFFPEPDKFNPDRFSKERKADIKPYTFLPYGVGPRQCFVMQFSEAEMKAGIVAIVSHFEIRKTPRTPSKLEMEGFGLMTQVKGGLCLDFIRRM